MNSVISGFVGGAMMLALIATGAVDRWMPWSKIEATGQGGILYLDLVGLSQAYPQGISESEAIQYMQEVQRILIDLTSEGYVVVDADMVIYGQESKELDPAALMRAAENRIKGAN